MPSPLQILIYGDSMAWGIVPDTRERFAFDARWPGVLEINLQQQGYPVRVLEDCLNGRRTVWDDPFKAGRNGLYGLAQRIESHSPLALVILALGVNDFQSMHVNQAWHSAQGMAALIQAIRQAPIEPGMPVPPILLLAPPPMSTPKGQIAPKFVGGENKSAGLATAYRELAQQQACHFFDMGSASDSSRVDGIHLDADQHLAQGRALAGVVASLLPVPVNDPPYTARA